MELKELKDRLNRAINKMQLIRIGAGDPLIIDFGHCVNLHRGMMVTNFRYEELRILIGNWNSDSLFNHHVMRHVTTSSDY